jgi:hypothetical protein
MRSINVISLSFLAVFLMAFSGCGSSEFAPVSGTVTSDGKPVGKLRVVFSPIPIDDDPAVAPFSIGITDADGKFTLETRYGDPGAFVGKHTTSYQYTDIGEDAMTDMRDQMDDAKDNGDKEAFKEAQQKIAKMKAKLKGRPILMDRYNAVITVPEGGTDDFKLELTEMEGQ